MAFGVLRWIIAGLAGLFGGCCVAQGVFWLIVGCGMAHWGVTTAHWGAGLAHWGAGLAHCGAGAAHGGGGGGAGVAFCVLWRGSLGGRGVWRVSLECYDGSLQGRRGSMGGRVVWRGS